LGSVVVVRRLLPARFVVDDWADDLRSLLRAPSPAVLATYRAAGDVLGVLLRLNAREPRVWDLSAILPDRSAC